MVVIDLVTSNKIAHSAGDNNYNVFIYISPGP